MRRGVGGRLILGIGAGDLIEHERELANRFRNRPHGILIGVERHHAGTAGQAAGGANRGQRRERRRVRQRVAGVGAEAERGEAAGDGGRGSAARAGRAQRRIERVADGAADGADAEVPERKLVEVGLAEHDRPGPPHPGGDARIEARPMIQQRPRAARRRQTEHVDVVLEDHRDAVHRSPPASGRALRVEGTRLRDRRRIQREHRTQGRAVTIEPRQPRQVLPDHVLRRRVSARQRVLHLRHRLLDHRERRDRRRGGGRNPPVDDLRALQRRHSAEVRRRDEAASDAGYAGNLGSRLGNLRRGTGVRRRIFRRDQRIAQRDRKAATRIVDLAEPLHHERHQRDRLPRLEGQREDVAEVRGIVAGPSAGERVGVHVAHGGQQSGGVRAEHVRRRPMTRRPTCGIGHVLRVLHDRDEGVVQIDRPVAVRRGRHGHRSAIFKGARRSTPRDIEHAVVAGRVGVAVDVAQVVRVPRREQSARDQDVAVQHRRDGIEALAAVVREAEAREVLRRNEYRSSRGAHAELEIAEAVERIRPAAGRDAAAVLRPGRRVLDVPELAVGGRQARDRSGTPRQQRDDGRGAEHRRRDPGGAQAHGVSRYAVRAMPPIRPGTAQSGCFA